MDRMKQKVLTWTTLSQTAGIMSGLSNIHCNLQKTLLKKLKSRHLVEVTHPYPPEN